MTLSSAWRTSFYVLPLVLILGTATAVLLFGDDCPNGHWENRYIPLVMEEEVDLKKVDSSATILQDAAAKDATYVVKEKDDKAEAVVPYEMPPLLSTLQIMMSPQTLLAALPYACTFGAELAVEGIISGLYQKQSLLNGGVAISVATAGELASIFGLMNFVTRPGKTFFVLSI